MHLLPETLQVLLFVYNYSHSMPLAFYADFTLVDCMASSMQTSQSVGWQEAGKQETSVTVGRIAN